MLQEKNIFTFKLGGEAGNGIMAAGLTFSKLATRSGYYIFNYTEYPSLIRGGHNVMQTSISTSPVFSQYSSTDFLIALNQETLELHKSELSPSSRVLYDSSINIHPDSLPCKSYAIPLTEIVKKANGSMIMRNAAALSAAITLLGGSLEIFSELLDEELGGKKELVRDMNHRIIDIAKTYIQENYLDDIADTLKVLLDIKPQIVTTGNDAAALGALQGGMSFFSVYPMTPTSNIMHYLAPLQKDYNFIYKQPEDEISAINMAIGASFAGARSMVATSGGGFCLMSEGYGLAGITETPIVIIEGMRGSPATGLPTWTEQGDLRFVLHAHQGDFPRIVLAPGDTTEVFKCVADAFNLADIYQCPVVVLLDKYLCESHLSTPPFTYPEYAINRGKFTTEKQQDFSRYASSPDGISTRSIPGSGNFMLANSDEHDNTGYSIEDSKTRIVQMQKRMQKLKTCEQAHMQPPILYGDPAAPITVVSWGSNKGPIVEALKQVDHVNFLQITWLNPFPASSVTSYLKKSKHIVNLECNYSAQLAGLIREKTGINITDNFLKYDGRPFYPEEIVKKLNSLKF